VRIEKKLNRLDEVRATVNYATASLRVTAPAAMPVAELIAAVERAGYTARPAPADSGGRAGAPFAQGILDQQAAPGEPADPADRHAAYLRRRLIVAQILFIPLTELSLMPSLVPSLRLPGWQWLPRPTARARAPPGPADRRQRADRGAAAGIDQVIAGTLPADKAAVITGLQAGGYRVQRSRRSRWPRSASSTRVLNQPVTPG